MVGFHHPCCFLRLFYSFSSLALVGEAGAAKEIIIFPSLRSLVHRDIFFKKNLGFDPMMGWEEGGIIYI